jgi:UDP-N-acetylglucosamine 2-epimerase
MKIVSVVGARPQFVKAAALSRAIRARHDELLVHTGQHYDYGMSAAFFDELNLPEPAINLGAGSGSHAAQTALMLSGIERVLLDAKPDWLIVYGDTNSTIAAALAAAKLQVRVAHVEAGLRSFNRAMPEEINRVVTDHLSTVLFAPSQTAVDNLTAEGIRRGVAMVGDVMADTLLGAAERARTQSQIMTSLSLEPGAYFVATMHRAENTDHPERLAAILSALDQLRARVVLPIHPRTRKMLTEYGLTPGSNVELVAPLSYLDMIRLVEPAKAVLTDSGGLQKEAYWLGVPCVTLRDETEWVETVASGWNTLAGADTTRIVSAAGAARRLAHRPTLYGDGRSAQRCVDVLEAAVAAP